MKLRYEIRVMSFLFFDPFLNKHKSQRFLTIISCQYSNRAKQKIISIIHKKCLLRGFNLWPSKYLFNIYIYRYKVSGNSWYVPTSDNLGNQGHKENPKIILDPGLQFDVFKEHTQRMIISSYRYRLALLENENSNNKIIVPNRIKK